MNFGNHAHRLRLTELQTRFPTIHRIKSSRTALYILVLNVVVGCFSHGGVRSPDLLDLVLTMVS